MDELAGDSDEPVSTNIAVTKPITVTLPARNESPSAMDAMRIAFFASGVTKMRIHIICDGCRLLRRNNKKYCAITEIRNGDFVNVFFHGFLYGSFDCWQ